MANLLTYWQMDFLKDKVFIEYYTGSESEVKWSEYDKAVCEDGSVRSAPKDNSSYWKIYGTFRPNFEYECALSRVYYNSSRKAMCTATFVYIIPKDFIAACKKYFGGTPLYVGTKRVNQAICKVGGVLKTVQNIYIKQGGNIKKIM